MTNLIELCLKYPIKNGLWHRSDTMFTTDASMVSNYFQLRDPWKRTFPHPPKYKLDNEGDTLYWDYLTTVNGEEVTCRVFNT